MQQQNFQKFLTENFGFTDEELDLETQFFETEKFKKNEIILNAGEICKKIYFVKSGLLRTFHLSQNGTEFTRLFASEFQFCTILLSFSGQIASAATIQALENTEVLSVTKSKFQEIISHSEKAKNAYTKILEDFQNFQISRIEYLTTLSPQEKVEQFLAENVDLEKRVSSKIIATYLQITPETYSRCKTILKS